MSELETIAEIAIAIAGFAGIAYVVGHSGVHSDIRTWRIRSLLTASFLTMTAALFPLGLPYLAVSADAIPRFGSAFLATCIVLTIAIITPGFVRLNVAGRSALGKRFFFTMLPLSSIMILVQLGNALWGLGEFSNGVLYYGLLLMLVIGAAQFLVLIIDATEGNG